MLVFSPSRARRAASMRLRGLTVLIITLAMGGCPPEQVDTLSGGPPLGLGGVSEGPGAGSDPSTSPVVYDEFAFTPPDAPVAITLSGEGGAGRQLNFAIVSPPSRGVLSDIQHVAANAAEVVYTPPPGFVGTVQFSYRAEDGEDVSNTATVLIAVYPPVCFELDVYEGPCPLTVRARAFTVTGDALPEGEYRWDFGGTREAGAVNTHGERTHTFFKPGVYAVTLSLTLAGFPTSITCNHGSSNDSPEAHVVAGDAESTVSISGHVFDLFGEPLAGIRVETSDGAETGSDQAGAYALDVPSGWSGTVAPADGDRLFEPEYRQYENIATNQTGQDFSECWQDVPSEGYLFVSPAEGLSSSGPEGGPFDPASKEYTLENSGGQAIEWSAAGTEDWLAVSPAGGTLDPSDDPVTVTVSINANADALPTGIYEAAVLFTNTTNGSGDAERAVSLTVYEAPPLPGVLSVSPLGGFSSSGPEGGPFDPPSKEYTLKNTGGEVIDWTVSKTQPWVSLSNPTSGMLDPNESASVTVSINANANDLSAQPNPYTDTVSFTNTTNHRGDATRGVSLTVHETGGEPGPMTTASRTSGVAPLGVFFDCIDDPNEPWVSNVVQPPDGDYASYHYEWNFGDPGSGTWSTGRQNPDGTYPSKNETTGYVAAHVYEEPGIYTVHLTVTTADDQVLEHEQQIEVLTEPPGGWTTYYVSSSHPSRSDSNPGTDPGAPLETVATAVSMARPNTRILFKRGDSWTISTTATISADGPGLIGAYYRSDGRDDPLRPRPLIRQTSTGRGLGLSDDWRIMDLELLGPGSASQGFGVGGVGSTQRQWLLLRVRIHGFMSGAGFGPSDSHNHNLIVESDLRQGNDIYIGGKRLGILGTNAGDNLENGEHVLRIWHAYKSIICHNTLLDPQPNKHCLKLHNVEHLGLPPGEYIVIAHNQFGGAEWPVAIGPQNAERFERVRRLVFERNICSGGTRGLMLWAQRVTVRNNVFRTTGSPSLGYTGVNIETRGVEPPPEHVWVYNNTIYSDAVGVHDYSPFRGIHIKTGTDIIVRNNLASAPNWDDGAAAVVVAEVPVSEDHNLLADNPGFVAPDENDFRLEGQSAAKDVGLALPHVREDCLCTARPQAEGYDLGATEQ